MSLVEQLKKTVRAKRLYNDLPKEDFLKEISFRSSYGERHERSYCKRGIH